MLVTEPAAVPRNYEINPLLDHTFEAVESHIVELHDVLVGLSRDVNRLYGLDEETPTVYNHMDFNSQRATNLQDPKDDQDAVTLSYLRRWFDRYTDDDTKPGGRI